MKRAIKLIFFFILIETFFVGFLISIFGISFLPKIFIITISGLILFFFGSIAFCENYLLRIFRAKPISSESWPGFQEILLNESVKAKTPVPQVYLIEDFYPYFMIIGKGAYQSKLLISQAIFSILNDSEVEAVVLNRLHQLKTGELFFNTLSAFYGSLFARRVEEKLKDSSLSSTRKSFYFILSVVALPISWVIVRYFNDEREILIADKFSSEITGVSQSLANAINKVHNMTRKLPSTYGNSGTAHLQFVYPENSFQQIGLFDSKISPHSRIEALFKSNR